PRHDARGPADIGLAGHLMRLAFDAVEVRERQARLRDVPRQPEHCEHPETDNHRRSTHLSNLSLFPPRVRPRRDQPPETSTATRRLRETSGPRFRLPPTRATASAGRARG